MHFQRAFKERYCQLLAANSHLEGSSPLAQFRWSLSCSADLQVCVEHCCIEHCEQKVVAATLPTLSGAYRHSDVRMSFGVCAGFANGILRFGLSDSTHDVRPLMSESCQNLLMP